MLIAAGSTSAALQALHYTADHGSLMVLELTTFVGPDGMLSGSCVCSDRMTSSGLLWQCDNHLGCCCRFFGFLFSMFLCHQLAVCLFRCMGAIGRTLVVAYTIAWLLFLMFLLLGGFVLTKGRMPMHVSRRVVCQHMPCPAGRSKACLPFQASFACALHATCLCKNVHVKRSRASQALFERGMWAAIGRCPLAG